MSLESGTKLGPYEILEPLASGTGESYKASDSQHGRTVTIRMLAIRGNTPESSRIERETQAIAALEHPGIGRVYELGHQDDLHYLVSEHLDGETLAQRLARGPLPLAEALDVAIALAHAVDQAHRRGIVHRNLSPSSVMLTGEGVKVLDFGLDPPTEGGESAPVSIASTRSLQLSAAMAEASPSMPYQAPEQLAGKAADARSDVFAVGAILYEMVTGKPAFEGKTQALLVAAITTVDPDHASEIQPLAPPALDYVIGRCLVKDPGKRLQSARDLAAQLRWIAGEGAGAGLAATLAAGKTRETWTRLALAAAVVLALGLLPLVYLSLRGAPEPVEARYIVRDMGFVNAQGTGAGTFALSPNGRWLTTSRGGTAGLDALALDSVTKQILLPGHEVYFPFWNPNNQEEVAFWEGGFLKRALVSGGQATNIVEVPTPYGGGTWSPDDVIVYSSQGILFMVEGGEGVPITSLDDAAAETEHIAPAFLPDGRHFLFVALSSQPENSAIFVGSIDSPERTRLFAANTRPVYSDGHILFNRGDVLYAQAFDPDALRIQGEPRRVADGVLPVLLLPVAPITQSYNNMASFAATDTGILAYRMGAAPSDGSTATGADGSLMRMTWFGANTPPPVQQEGTYAGVDLAPDGRRFAVHRHDGNGGDIWIYDPDQGGFRRLTTDPSQENASPIWSPEGDRIAFASNRSGRWGIYVRAVDGTGAETTLVEGTAPLAPMSWPASGEVVYWETVSGVWAVSETGEDAARLLLSNDEDFPQVSPDGNWIAYQRPDPTTGQMQIWVNRFPDPEGPGWQITNEGGIWPRWRPDGEVLEIYFVLAPNMMSVRLRVAGQAIAREGLPEVLFPVAANPNQVGSTHYVPGASYLRYAVSADGERFLVAQPAGTTAGGTGAAPIADAIRNAVEGNQDPNATPGTAANEIAVILDWTRTLIDSD